MELMHVIAEVLKLKSLRKFGQHSVPILFFPTFYFQFKVFTGQVSSYDHEPMNKMTNLRHEPKCKKSSIIEHSFLPRGGRHKP